MEAASASPDVFVEAGIRNEEFMDIMVGEQIIKVCIVGAAGIVGASALGEAKDVLVDTLTNTFGKYKSDNITTDSEAISINDIEDNEFDGSPNAQTALDFKDTEGEDAAAKSFDNKKAKWEARSNNGVKVDMCKPL